MDRLNDEYGVVMETLHPAAATRILNDFHRKVTVSDGEISLQVDGQKLRYFDVDSPLCGEEGAEYLAYLPKGDYSTIYLTDGKRRYLGELPRRIGGKYGDIDARNRQLADKRKALARHTRAIRERHVKEIDKAIADTGQTLQLMKRLDGNLLDQGAALGGGAPDVVTQISGSIAEREQAFADADAKKAKDAQRGKCARAALLANAK